MNRFRSVRHLRAVSALCICGLIATACGPGTISQQSGLSRFALFNNSQQVQGARPLIEEPFEQVDLTALLDRAGTNPNLNSKTQLTEPANDRDAELQLANAFQNFYAQCMTPSQSCVLSRNRVQERIIAASEQRCASYKQWIKQFQAEGEFTLGTVATTLAGLGAIFTGVGTVRALSGAAAIVSGTRAEFDQALFSNLAVQVITKGIDTQRSAFYKEIQERQDESIREYTVEAAVADALEYHGACSVLSGLEYAQFALDVIRLRRNPGMTELGLILTPNRAGAALASIDDARKTLTALKEKTSELSKRIAKLPSGSSKTSLTTEAENLGKEVDAAKTKLDELAGDVDKANSKITTARTKLETTTDTNERAVLNLQIQEGNNAADAARLKVSTLIDPLTSKATALTEKVITAEKP